MSSPGRFVTSAAAFCALVLISSLASADSYQRGYGDRGAGPNYGYNSAYPDRGYGSGSARSRNPNVWGRYKYPRGSAAPGYGLNYGNRPGSGLNYGRDRDYPHYYRDRRPMQNKPKQAYDSERDAQRQDQRGNRDFDRRDDGRRNRDRDYDRGHDRGFSRGYDRGYDDRGTRRYPYRSNRDGRYGYGR